MIAKPAAFNPFQPQDLFAALGRLRFPRAGEAADLARLAPDKQDAEPMPQADGEGHADPAELSPLSRALAPSGGASALFEFNFQAVHSISEVREGNSITRTEFFAASFEMNLTVSGDPEAAKALFEKLKAEFIPEKVADRIATFATAGFGRLKDGEGKGVLQDRAAFRDFIQKAVEQGYGQALGLLGPVDGEVKGGLEKTLQFVRDRLDAWVKEGQEAADAPVDAPAPAVEVLA